MKYKILFIRTTTQGDEHFTYVLVDFWRAEGEPHLRNDFLMQLRLKENISPLTEIKRNIEKYFKEALEKNWQGDHTHNPDKPFYDGQNWHFTNPEQFPPIQHHEGDPHGILAHPDIKNYDYTQFTDWSQFGRRP